MMSSESGAGCEHGLKVPGTRVRGRQYSDKTAISALETVSLQREMMVEKKNELAISGQALMR